MFQQIPAGMLKAAFAHFLAGNDAADRASLAGGSRESLTSLRDKLRGEKELVIAFGSELRGEDIQPLVQFAKGVGAQS